MIDLSRYDAALRGGAYAYDIAKKAGCSKQLVYQYMRKNGIVRDRKLMQRRRKRQRVIHPSDRFNYLGWMISEQKRLGMDVFLWTYYYRDWLEAYRRQR